MESTNARKAILDALSQEEEESIGKPDLPTKPLVGSENVPVTPKEEELYREG